MIRLYLAQDNATNYLIIRDFHRDDNDAAVINWDLSEDELKDLLLTFAESLKVSDIDAGIEGDYEFEPFSEIIGRCTQWEEVFFTPENAIF